MECCPHCGGETGFQTVIYTRGIQHYKWNACPNGYEDGGIPERVLLPVCSDCGKRVKIDD